MSNVSGPGTAPDRDQAFIRLVDRYKDQVLRMCFLSLRDRTLAEDAAQETFLKVYRKMESFRGESSEKTWIMKIAPATLQNHIVREEVIIVKRTSPAALKP